MIDLPQEHIDQWKETMKDYKGNKTKLEWGTNPKVTYVNETDKKCMERQYDPILQKFRDDEKESGLKKVETDDMVHTLAKNKVFSCLYSASGQSSSI
jgi:hypothetical protein